MSHPAHGGGVSYTHTHTHTHTHIYIYIYIYNYVYEEKYNLKWEDPRRDLYLLNFFVLTYVLYMCMFSACCFCQRICVAQGLVNGVLNATWTHFSLLFEWPLVSQAGFI